MEWCTVERRNTCLRPEGCVEAKTKNTLWTNHIAVVELDGGKHFAPEELTSYREDAKPLRDRGRGSRWKFRRRNLTALNKDLWGMRQRLQLLDCLHLVCFHIKRKWCSVCLQELVSEGPVPWVSKNSVTFVAEQVSHHPPSKWQSSSATSTFRLLSKEGHRKLHNWGLCTVLVFNGYLCLPSPMKIGSSYLFLVWVPKTLISFTD